MTLEADDEILQDFLVEAGEILEQLGEQLVELEQSPEDSDLLNAVFRGFHTVKGGAGFLNITAMVDVCHRAEDVFNVLRQGEKILTPAMMDYFLKVLDILNEQFAQIGHGGEPTPAEPQFLAVLEAMSVPGNDTVPPIQDLGSGEAPASPAPAAAEGAAEGDITDREFEALLDEMEGQQEAAPAPAPSSDEITDEEFEQLLDTLHGEGKGPTVDAASAAPAAPAASAKADEITDDEFDQLLDTLHGQGRGPGAAAGSGPADAVAQAPASNAVAQDHAAEHAVAASAMTGGAIAGTAVAGDTVTLGAATAAAAAPEPEPKPAPKPVPAKSDGPGGSGKPSPRTAETTVRVDTKRLDDIMNMVGELVLVRNRLATLKSTMGDEEVSKAVANLDLVTSDLQASVMKTRMQPIKKVFGRFPRVVRDLARSLKKEVELELVGEETDLDKNLVEALADPLVHLVRNSVDHGIEMPAEREDAGKPRAGKVILAAAQEGDHILLTISDDGAGMDAEVLRRKAVEKGVMDAESAARLDAHECYNLIFAPGFSTKTEISDVSGRGVGMDVVKTRIAQLNGSIEITSEKGRGTCISIKLPLTLAILPTLMVKVGSRNFALPLTSVNEIFHLEEHHTNEVDGQLVVMVRERAMPLFYLHRWLLRKGDEYVKADTDTEQVVVTNVGNQRVGFVVNQVVGQEEVVIKPLGAMLHGLPGFAGATITGDGRIALILDVPSLMNAYARR